MRITNYFAACALFLVSFHACAGWHGGAVQQLNVGYDGKTITFRVDGWTRTDCTCYSAWPSTMCLDSMRDTYDFEKAILLSARARGSVVNAYIDEGTCSVQAIYEIN